MSLNGPVRNRDEARGPKFPRAFNVVLRSFDSILKVLRNQPFKGVCRGERQVRFVFQ